MTTTLRPTAPEQRTPDGGRARSYEVCVNSRPVGRIDLATDARFGAGVGRITHLRIDPRDRHRGRGTVAALAAEEVLRGWGCGRVEISVGAAAEVALGLAGALGYVERNRNMAKTLTAAPRLPEGTEGRPMTTAEFTTWERLAREAYAQDWISRGVPPEQAHAKAEADHRSALPDGLTTPGAVLSVLTHRGEPVGTLWVTLRTPSDHAPGDPGAYVYDVEVAEARRGHGHGRALMLLAEGQALAAGETLLGLNVFAGNTPALRLYESLGYRPTRFHLYKALL
ncbi:acetyltransferase [Streptomyces eurocidicus]|uniref:Acetyltransferase n=1 Tax=Streptomyces eurocidicus TaxID=66423 RepID=A0A2N8NN89_STREU|nr:GNAT family N-acetyltransferase [Streptomyces eurocidicus]MBB5118118.1 ribosomal protein S18 acetylase RimI-like enzyme [Streptomyces eurocidicus]MBF6054496.1 GNAT family N-acetyltransferase [Streptomyces eurocidicus]PNE30224.1 acetyltransferase [Streptomyces eurocidicus]